MSVLRRPRVFPRRRHRPEEEDPLIFAGSASPRLTTSICRELGVEVGANEVVRFSEGTLFVRVLENVRGRSVYVVQSTVFPTNANFMELLFWVDALSRASADSVTVVVPYFSYAKGDKKDEPRVSIRARVCADAIEAAGADRVVTLDLHAPQIQGFFRIPVDDLYAMPYLCRAIERASLRDPVVVSPDAGFVTAVVTHGVFTEGSMERLDGSPIERLIVTDSIETQPVEVSAKVTVVSVAPLFAEAIGRIHRRESISVLFQE